MSDHVERIDRTLVRRGAIIDIYEDTVRLPDGSCEKWDFVAHRMGAACVVPVTPEGRILLVRQYRPALDRYTWELPAGCRDAVDEPTDITAKREMEEETGYTSDDIRPLLSLKSTVAFCNELIDVYLAMNIVRVKEQSLDPAEEISMKLWELQDILDEIYAGRLQDAKTVAGILAYANTLSRSDHNA